MRYCYPRSFFAIFCIGLLTLACSRGAEEAQNPLSEEEQESVEVRPEVIFATADDQPLYQYVESTGVVEARRQVVLKPKIGGFIEQLMITEGRRVAKGDTLLAFNRQELQNAVAQAQNEYDKTLNLYQAEKQVLQSDGSALSKDSMAIRDRGIKLRVGLAQAQVDLKRAKIDLAFATLVAPFAGMLSVNSQQRLSEGAYVAAGTEVGQLVSTGRVQVRVDVLEAELERINPGMAVQITSPSGRQMSGRVSSVMPVVDTESKTGQIMASVDNSKQVLRPGNTVDVRILIQKETGKARIPRAAILSRDGGRTLIFKLHPENDEVEWIYVEPIAQNANWAIINNEGIAPGDTLAVDNHFALSHLQIVDPKMQAMQLEDEESSEM